MNWTAVRPGVIRSGDYQIERLSDYVVTLNGKVLTVTTDAEKAKQAAEQALKQLEEANGSSPSLDRATQPIPELDFVQHSEVQR